MLSAGSELLLVYRHLNSVTNQYQSVCKSGGGEGYVFTLRVRGVDLFLVKKLIFRCVFHLFCSPKGCAKVVGGWYVFTFRVTTVDLFCKIRAKFTSAKI